MRGGGGLMRAMFTAYLVVIVVGLGYFLAVGVARM